MKSENQIIVRCKQPCRHAIKHVCHPCPEKPALARTRVQSGRWSHPQGHSVWGAHHRKPANWPAHPAPQGCLEEGPQWRGMMFVLINAELEAETSDRTSLAIKDQGWRQIGGGEEREGARRKNRESASDRLQSSSAVASILTTGYICSKCHRSCGSRMGLHSHSRRCTSS